MSGGIERIIYGIKDMAFGDVIAASRKARMGGFILGSCLIDQMAWFCIDGDGLGNHYRKFITAYMPPGYVPEDMWESVRSALVHRYSVKGPYQFTHGRGAGEHFSKDANGRINLNLEDFVDDLGYAVRGFCNRLRTDTQVQALALARLSDKDYPGVLTIRGGDFQAEQKTVVISSSDMIRASDVLAETISFLTDLGVRHINDYPRENILANLPALDELRRSIAFPLDRSAYADARLHCTELLNCKNMLVELVP
jgi:hypothetical protein